MSTIDLNRIMQDQTTEVRCMRGLKEHDAADHFCREHDEVRNFPAADPATTNTFRLPADAVTSSITLALRSASCGPHDQNNS